jgi:hypothetical protein
MANLKGGREVAEERNRATEDSGFDFETKTLGHIRCHPLDLEVLFRFTDLVKAAPETVRECICSLLSAAGERWDATLPEDRGISREQARTLTDQELEQFAARFLEATNWIGPGETAELTTDGIVECSYGERLDLALKTYERRLTSSKLRLLPNPFSDVVPKRSQKQSKSTSDAYIEPKGLAHKGSAQDKLSSFRRGGVERRHRVFGLVAKKLKEFLKGGRDWQEQKGARFQRMRRALGSLKTLQQNLLDLSIIRFRALQKIGRQPEGAGVQLKALRSKSTKSGIKAIYNRVLVGIFIIGLSTSAVLDLVTVRSLALRQLAATANLNDAVRNLSERMDAQSKALTELIEQRSSEHGIVAQQVGHLDTKRQRGLSGADASARRWARDSVKLRHSSVLKVSRK